MKLSILITLCCLLSGLSFSQSIPSDSLKFQLQDPKFLADGNQQIDSLQLSFYQKSDSLKQAYKNKFSKIDSTRQRLTDKLNKLTSPPLGDKKITGVQKLDSSQTAFHGECA